MTELAGVIRLPKMKFEPTDDEAEDLDESRGQRIEPLRARREPATPMRQKPTCRSHAGGDQLPVDRACCWENTMRCRAAPQRPDRPKPIKKEYPNPRLHSPGVVGCGIRSGNPRPGKRGGSGIALPAQLQPSCASVAQAQVSPAQQLPEGRRRPAASSDTGAEGPAIGSRRRAQAKNSCGNTARHGFNTLPGAAIGSGSNGAEFLAASRAASRRPPSSGSAHRRHVAQRRSPARWPTSSLIA